MQIIEGKLQYAGNLASCFFNSVVEGGLVIGTLIVSWFAFAGYRRVLRGKIFWHPDPEMPRYLLPRPGPDWKIVNPMASTPDRPDNIFPGLDRTETI